MYPKKLEFDPYRVWFDEEYLDNDKFVNVYLHEDYDVKMHSHQFYEINIIINGDGRHYIGDTDLAAHTGDVFVIPPEIPHGYYTNGRLDIYHILIKNVFLSRYREELLELPGYDILFNFEPLIRQFSGTEMNLNISTVKLEEIKKELENIRFAEENGRYFYENILILNFISKLGKLLNKKLKNDNGSTRENREIIAVMEYIKDNLGNKITLSKIAKFGNMSTATLNRRFREYLNISPMEYVTKCRVNLARELIDEKKCTKAEIAQICGFYDSVHMNKTLIKFG